MFSPETSHIVLVVVSNPLVAEGLDSAMSRRRGLMAVPATLDSHDRVIPRPGAAVGIRPSVALVEGEAIGAACDLVAANPDLGLVAYLAADDTTTAQRCIAMGFRGVFGKTTPTETILAALNLVARGGVYVDAPFAGLPVEKAPPAPSPLAAGLSEREVSVLRGLAQGMSAKEIGLALSLSGKTVETYKARAASKLNLRSRREIVEFVTRNGWTATPI